jgi:pimeloyl-ACP methyl ester carboxylesterase
LIDLHGRDIEVWTARSPGAKSSGTADAYALEFTGNATRAEYIVQTVAQRWDDRSVEVWVMNYPGFGASTGPASLPAIPPAALAAYDALAHEAQGKPIIVSGSSLGTTAALYVAANRPVTAMFLQNPPPLQRMILQKYGWIAPAPIVAQIPDELNSLMNAPHVKAPAIFVLSGKDQVVAPQYQQMVLDAYAGEKHLVRMPDAGHNSPITGAAAEQLQHELDWIWSKVRVDGLSDHG